MRWLLAWAFYWAGDFTSKAQRWDWGWTYPIYNRLMTISSDIQGPTDNGPWSAILK